MRYKADLVSALFERWRINDRASELPLPTLAVYDQGDQLTGGGTDYTWTTGAPVVALVAEAGEPLTVEWTGSNTLGGAYAVLDQLLEERGPLARSDFDRNGIVSVYGSNPLGFLVRERRQISDLLAADLLAPTLSHTYLKLDGSLALDVLVPPVSPSVRDGGCLEFISAERFGGAPGEDNRAYVRWASPVGALAGREFSVGAFVKICRPGPDSYDFPAFNVLDTANASAGLQLAIDLTATGWTLTAIRWVGGNPTTTRSLPLPFASEAMGKWVFVAISNDDPLNFCEFFAAEPFEPGDTPIPRSIGTTAALGFSSAPTVAHVLVGGSLVSYLLRGSIMEPQMWDGVLDTNAWTDAAAAPLAGSETNLAFYAALDGEGTTSRTDLVSSTAGTITGNVREVPDLVVDLTSTSRPWRQRNLVPAKRIEVRGRRNYDPLNPADFAPAVGQSDRLAQSSPWRVIRTWQSDDVAADYLDARELVLETPFDTEDGVAATLALARWRFAPGREFAVLGPTPGAPLRTALLLNPGAELRVYGYQDLATGIVYRVVGNRRIMSALDAELRLWR